MADLSKLPRRERQIMDFLIANGSGTVADVVGGITDSPSYSAIRAMLAKLERKGYITHVDADRAYRYTPVSRERTRTGAVRHMIDSLFGGSTTQAVTALLKADDNLSDDDLDRLAKIVAAHRKASRK